MQRKSKIVCTLGPASSDPAIVRRLILAGMDVARLNFSHGSHEEHLQLIKQVKSLASELGRPVAILQDLAGPKIRIGQLGAEEIRLLPGETFILTAAPVVGDSHRVSINYPGLPAEVKSGDSILLADGSIELEVMAVRRAEIETRVVVGGSLSSFKGVNVPSRSLKIPAITEKDRADLEFGLHCGVDWVALSFVRGPQDLLPAREIMSRVGREVPLIAKIEKREAIENIDAIIAEVEGIMVARGDLGVETPLERVPLLQKMLIAKCNAAGRPVITATQMLRSMVDSPRPTRAEAADVANAVMDGTDALMLSEETAIGSNPVAAVEMMARLAVETEARLTYGGRQWRIQSIPEAVGHAACLMAAELKAAGIFAATQTGSTARLISRFRPRAPIFALTPLESTYRCLSLCWGVQPLLGQPFDDTDSLFAQVRDLVSRCGLADSGQVLIVTAGVPLGVSGTTNMVKAMVV